MDTVIDIICTPGGMIRVLVHVYLLNQNHRMTSMLFDNIMYIFKNALFSIGKCYVFSLMIPNVINTCPRTNISLKNNVQLRSTCLLVFFLQHKDSGKFTQKLE